MEDEPLHVCPFSSTLTCEVTQDFVRFRLAFPITPSDNRKRNLCWCDVTWVPRPFKSPSTRLFVHPVFKLTSNKTLELHVTGPLYPEARGFPNGKRWETLSVAWRHHDHHESIDIHRCSQNGHVCLNSALHKLILHVHVRCWDFTIVPVSALGVTLEDMGKMHQSPTVQLVGFLRRHVLFLIMRHTTLKMSCVRLAYAP